MPTATPTPNEFRIVELRAAREVSLAPTGSRQPGLRLYLHRVQRSCEHGVGPDQHAQLDQLHLAEPLAQRLPRRIAQVMFADQLVGGTGQQGICGGKRWRLLPECGDDVGLQAQRAGDAMVLGPLVVGAAAESRAQDEDFALAAA